MVPRIIPPYDAIYAGDCLTNAEKLVETFEVRCERPGSMGMDGPQTQTLGGGVTDWFAAQRYAQLWRQRGIPTADIYVVDSAALRGLLL